MAEIALLTAAQMEVAKALIEDICDALVDYPTEGKRHELGRRLYAALGDIHFDDWPAVFGHGGFKGASTLATAYNLERLAHVGAAAPWPAKKSFTAR